MVATVKVNYSYAVKIKFLVTDAAKATVSMVTDSDFSEVRRKKAKKKSVVGNDESSTLACKYKELLKNMFFLVLTDYHQIHQ